MDGKSYKYVTCNFGEKPIKGGIIRMKNHLADNHKGVAPCVKVSDEVKKEIIGYLQKFEKNKMDTQRNREEIIENGAYYQSKIPYLGISSSGSGSVTRGVRGPMDRCVVDLDGDGDVALNVLHACLTCYSSLSSDRVGVGVGPWVSRHSDRSLDGADLEHISLGSGRPFGLNCSGRPFGLNSSARWSHGKAGKQTFNVALLGRPLNLGRDWRGYTRVCQVG
ncbi:hypothetical protein OROHE_003322 [Orobanche hederae]